MTAESTPNLPPGVPTPIFDGAATSVPTPTPSPLKPRSSIWDRKIGSFWLKEDKAGEKFLRGELADKKGQKMWVFLLKNKNKRNPNAPDWEMFMAESQQGSGQDIV